MKRFYRLAGIITMPTVTLNPTFIGQPMTVGLSEPGQWQVRVRYGNRQFWLIATRKGLKEFFDLSVREQMSELDRLLGKRNASPVFFGTQQQPQQQPADPMFVPTEWDCSCGKTKNNGKYCPACGSRKPEPKYWECRCGCRNDEADKFCTNCGAEQPQPVTDPIDQLKNAINTMAQQIAALQQAGTQGNP